MSTIPVFCENCGAFSNDSNAKYCMRCGILLPVHNLPQKHFNACLKPGSLLKQQYRILEVLGEGGMGTVYRAVDESTFNRIVAVKEVFQKEFESESDIQNAATLLEGEAATLARLSHQNLPRIYNYFTEAKRWYLVMDFIDGETLSEYLIEAGGKLDIDKTLEIGEKLCTVLGYLHKQKPPIIFRDVKPDNVMLTRDEEHLYLIDFGISRRFHAVTTQSTNTPRKKADTDPGLGSHGYAPPEQYRGYTTPLSDIYALGATLHQLLSGEQPSGSFLFEPLQLMGYPGGVELNTLIINMVDKEEVKRPTSMQVVKNTLKDIADRRSEFEWASTTTHQPSVISTNTPPIPSQFKGTSEEYIASSPNPASVEPEEQPIPEPPPPQPSTQTKPHNWREFVEYQNANQAQTLPPPATHLAPPTRRLTQPPVDFFILYHDTDEDWAEWIAWQLEDANYTTTLKAWDFQSSTDLQRTYQEALMQSERVISIISPKFLSTRKTRSLLTPLLGEKTANGKNRLISICVHRCDEKALKNLLDSTIIHLTGMDEAIAREILLMGIRNERLKPATAPLYPGEKVKPVPPFPTPSGPQNDTPSSTKTLTSPETSLLINYHNSTPISNIDIFISYAHKDERLRNRLYTHLSSIKRQNSVKHWDDGEIMPGGKWHDEILTHLRTAHVILLLVSPDFIASEYCYTIEMQEALARHQRGEACVIPIILRPVVWEHMPFGRLQARPKNGKPVTTWTNWDRAFEDIARSIQKVINQFTNSREA